jgi:peptidoglycan/LPS O-acetylase OafA/YrhL
MDNKIYFQGLNGIRAIAASIVLIFHLDQFMYLFGLKSIGFHTTGMARFGVILFFVLSGFLITFLMLKEKKQYTTINFKHFYLRRILRIWPIYYLILLITIVLMAFEILDFDAQQTPKILFLYAFLLSNVALALNLGIHTITPLWSVAVEEQFYLFVPFLLNNSQKVLKTWVYLAFIHYSLKVVAIIAFNFHVENSDFWYSFISKTAFDTMGIGGIMACLVFDKHWILRYLYTPLFQVIAWLFLVVSVIYKPIHFASILDVEIHAFMYSIIIVNVATNPKTIINLENKFFNFIGRISYGIYVYHMTVIFLFSYLIKDKLSSHSAVIYASIYLIVISLSVLVAYISYTYFESYFLRKKEKYTVIKSRN